MSHYYKKLENKGYIRGVGLTKLQSYLFEVPLVKLFIFYRFV